MLKSTMLRWALLGTSLVCAFGLGTCDVSSVAGIAPLAILAILSGQGMNPAAS